MQSVVLKILDESKTASLLSLLRDLSYVEVRSIIPPQTSSTQTELDVYAGITSKLDDDLLQSQFDILEKVDW